MLKPCGTLHCKYFLGYIHNIAYKKTVLENYTFQLSVATLIKMNIYLGNDFNLYMLVTFMSDDKSVMLEKSNEVDEILGVEIPQVCEQHCAGHIDDLDVDNVGNNFC